VAVVEHTFTDRQYIEQQSTKQYIEQHNSKQYTEQRN